MPRRRQWTLAGWAGSAVEARGDHWVADAPFGRVRIRFAARNRLGVMDHDGELTSGAVVHNPMRVVPNGEGSELVLTLICRPGMPTRNSPTTTTTCATTSDG